MNRPVEDYAINAVMAEWRLNHIMDATRNGLEPFYCLLLAAGWTRSEIATHRGQTTHAISAQMRKLKKRLRAI